MRRQNLEGALTALASQIAGATVVSVSQDGPKGVMELRLTSGRAYRVIFAGGVDTFPVAEGTEYRAIADEAATNATITWAGWDDSWLIIAESADQSLHIRLYGDPVAVGEV